MSGGAKSDSPLICAGTRAYIEQLRVELGIPGIAVGVVHTAASQGVCRSQIESFGRADAAGNPVTRDSVFAIASNSKVFAAIAVGLLIDQGTKLANGTALSWATKVKDVLPDWQLADPVATDLADLRDLATMRSGLGQHQFARSESDPAEVIPRLRWLRPNHEFRQEFQYQNEHYLILAHLIPALTGESYPEFLQRRLFGPLGMSSATQNAFDALKSGYAVDGFLRVGAEGGMGGDLGEAMPFGWWTDTDGLWSCGPNGLAISTEDMVRWMSELLEPRILPPHLVDLINTGETVWGPPSKNPECGTKVYGYGQWTDTYRGHQVVTHTGGMHGQSTKMLRIPHKGLGVWIAMNEGDYGGTFLEITCFSVLDRLLGLEPVNWKARLTGGSFLDRTLPQETAIIRPVPQDITVIGDYEDAGYGRMTIQSLDLTSESPTPLIAGLRDTLRKIGSSPEHLPAPTYLSSVHGKLYVSHMVIHHVDGPRFQMIPVKMFRRLDSQRLRTDDWVGYASSGMKGQVVFTTRGFGIFGAWSGFFGQHGRAAVEEDVEHQAEVWYDRV